MALFHIVDVRRLAYFHIAYVRRLAYFIRRVRDKVGVIR